MDYPKLSREKLYCVGYLFNPVMNKDMIESEFVIKTCRDFLTDHGEYALLTQEANHNCTIDTWKAT